VEQGTGDFDGMERGLQRALERAAGGRVGAGLHRIKSGLQSVWRAADQLRQSIRIFGMLHSACALRRHKVRKRLRKRQQ
jgi:hypothetical protein